jgi:hypothetical protein
MLVIEDKVATIKYETARFPSPLPSGLTIPKSGSHYVTPARLAWAAATVGYSPYGPTTSRRISNLEIQWRTAMVRASLSPQGRHFRCTDSYRRLDSSEKGALSFFLGQAQAKLFAHDMFRVFRLVHYDKYLEHLKTTRSKTRPDFIGFRHGGTAIAVEAKGRSDQSGRRDKRLVDSAKEQVKAIPAVKGYADPIRYVHIAFFDHAEWAALLVDPPSQRNLPPADPALLTLAYYEHIVTAILSARPDREMTELTDGIPYLRASFPDVDANILIREDIADRTAAALGDPQMAEDGAPPFAAAQLYELTIQLDSEKSAAIDARWNDTQNFFLGGDGVGIELGSSWENWAG